MKWFNDLRIGTKLLFGFILVALIAGLIGWIGYSNIEQLNNDAVSMFQTRLIPVRDLGYANGALLTARGDMRNVMMSTGDAERQKYVRIVEEQYSKANEYIDAYEKAELSTEERALLSKFHASWDEYHKYRRLVIELALKREDAKALEIMDGPARKNLADLRNHLAALIDLNAKLAERKLQEARSAAASSRSRILTILAFGMALAISLGLWIARIIGRPIADLALASNKLAAGNVDVRILVKSEDELGKLARSFNSMAESTKMQAAAADRIAAGDMTVKVQVRSDLDTLGKSLSRVAETVQKLVSESSKLTRGAAAGDLRVRGEAASFHGAYKEVVEGFNGALDAFIKPINEATDVLEKVAGRDLTARMNHEYQGEFVRIKNALNIAVQNLDEALEQVAVGAAQVASAAVQISSGSQSLSQGASEQASSIEEVSSSIQEMAAMTRQNAESANDVRLSSEGARESAEKGAASMKRLSDAMSRIKASSDSTAKIVKTIDEIAFQTNLLALNAAVEAARAGDAGKGFAVVAEEVRNLAMRSADAAKTTANLIEESVKNVEAGVAINQEVIRNLEEIDQQIRKVNAVMAEIAAGSAQQTEGVGQVSAAIEQMNAVTQHTAANAEESASMSEELSGQAEEMKGTISTFRLTGVNGSEGRPSLANKKIPLGLMGA